VVFLFCIKKVAARTPGGVGRLDDPEGSSAGVAGPWRPDAW